jgi:protein-S-isoprenylcysteine O-methyltransferase Ste14
LIVVPYFVLAGPGAASIAVGLALSLLGLALRAWSAGTIEKGEVLTVAGPYAHVRHPLYVGSFLIGGGLAIAGGSWLWLLLFCGFFVAMYGPTVSAEAARLTEQFGHRYVEYAAHVPAFVPRLRPFRSREGGSGGFRWSQYERNREWEASLGVAAAFALLWLKMVLLG